MFNLVGTIADTWKMLSKCYYQKKKEEQEEEEELQSFQVQSRVP